MRRIKFVAALLCSILASVTVAEDAKRSLKLAIRSTDLPNEERTLLESSFRCSSCRATEVQSVVLEQLHGLGYVKAVVSAPISTESVSNSGRLLQNTVAVRAGNRYYLGDLTINGVSTLSLEQVRKALLLRPGTVFSLPLLGRSLENLRRMYADAAKSNMVATPAVTFDEVHHVVSLTLDIDER